MATTVNEFNEVVELVTAQELIDQQNREFIASGGANDDKPTPQPPGSNSSTTSDSVPEIVITGTRPSKDKPGKRTNNPLGNFASYTYQITLYMITPDAYDAFVKSGRRKINAINNVIPGAAAAPQDVKQKNGAFIVAQSGGVNNASSKRAPGMNFDYYIDDLKVTTTVSTRENGTATNTSSMSFTITEPYGFSFITKLRNATNTLQLASKSKNFEKLTDPTRQFFVLGVRFQGYDINGNEITGKETFSGTKLDPNTGDGGVFERFWDIRIRTMKFKLEGKATVYRIEAAAMAPSVAFGVKRGIIDRGAKIVAKTVDEALMGNDSDKGVLGLLTKLNNDQLELEQAGTITKGMGTTYSIEWLGDAKVQIGNQTIVSKADLDKSKLPMAKSKTTKDSNDALSESAVPNSNKRQLVFKNGTPILQAIGLIIAQSSFLEEALKSVYTTAKEAEQGSNSDEQLVNSQTKTIKWYNLSAQVRCKGWCPIQSDFAYEIKYLIQLYETPIVLSPFAKITTKYPGAHKRYDYWYTGKNSEITSYEQVFDNTFTNVALAQNDTKGNSGHGGTAQIPTKYGGQNAQPTQGKPIPAMEAQNSFLTSLFDPGAWAKAKVQILGDPDFLMTESATSELNESYVYNQFYGSDGYTVNPNGGQVFVEIDFKEPVDYDHSSGLLSINESILMQQYPPTIAKVVKGVSYQVKVVHSTFSKGKFSQELDLMINTFEGLTEEQASGRSNGDGSYDIAENKRFAAYTQAPNNTGTGTSANPGLVPYDEFEGVDEAIAKQAALNQAAAHDAFYDIGSADQQTSPTGGSSIANIIASSPVVQASQSTGSSIPLSKDVQDGDAASNNTTNRVEEQGREA